MQVINTKLTSDYIASLVENNKEVTALFHANWSSFSNKIKDEFLKEKEDQYKNSKKIIIDIDRNRELMQRLGINQIPSLVTFTKDSLKKNDFIVKTINL